MTEAIEARTLVAEYRYTPDRLVPVLGEKWLPRDTKCVASARRFVRDVAIDWDAAEDVPEVAELLASELITNALTHGSVGVPATSTIRVTVSREKELLVVDVHDPSSKLPRLRQAGQLDLRGRGLAIVQTFSHHWGWALTPYGKSVWFQLLAWPTTSGGGPAHGLDS
ncbi:ATP-binding protein [Planotetraspora sp. GP83]|uniref:ATP-binding protein n=1 Tax=Planotetraspora sp. GP83 TaxID=3156264 RepID=UPI003512281E